MRNLFLSACCIALSLGIASRIAIAAPAPTVDDQVRGTCRTPREAMLQLLYWVQDSEHRVEPSHAAACFDGSDLDTGTLAERAIELKRTLDARAVYIDVDSIPSDPGYTDATGAHSWRLPQVPAIEIVRIGERWLFSAATVLAVPRLHDETVPPLLRRIVEQLPAWFHEDVLGLRIWQIFGVLLVLLLAFTLQKITVFLVGTYMRRATRKEALTVGRSDDQPYRAAGRGPGYGRRVPCRGALVAAIDPRQPDHPRCDGRACRAVGGARGVHRRDRGELAAIVERYGRRAPENESRS